MNSPFSAIANLYAQIEARRTRRRLLRRSAEVGVSAGSALLTLMAEAAPAVKPLLAVGTSAARAAIDSGSMPFDSLAPFEQALDLKISEVIVGRLANCPALVIVDDLHHCDERSLFAFEQLLRRPGGLRFGMVFSRDPLTGGDARLLPQLWERERLLHRRTLGGLPSEAIADLVTAQLAELPGKDRTMLVRAAAQGYWFDSATLGELAEKGATAARDRQHLLASTSHFIVPAEAPDWARRERADHYRFRHQALRRLIESLQSAEQRRDLHERIALAAIERLGESASYEQRLEIARHLREAGDHCFALSSDFHLALARDAATRLLGLGDAERLCGHAIDAAQAMPQDRPERHRRVVDSAMLYLSLTEVRWKGISRPTGERDSDALSAAAEAAAEALGDRALRARALMMRGKSLMTTTGLGPGLERLERAVEEARGLPDPTALYIATIEYGRQVSKRSLAAGIAQLTAAEELRRTDPRIHGSDDPVLLHARNLGEIQFGISLFDDGRLGRARERLETAVARLRREGNRTEFPIALNYLARLRYCLGETAAAEEVLDEAVTFENVPSGWRAYNTALLATVRAAAGHPEAECLQLMARAWQETERTWLLNLVPIVRNLHAELSLRAGRLDEAERLARVTVEETRVTGMVRSEIAAHSLPGRITLARGEREAALTEAAPLSGRLDGPC